VRRIENRGLHGGSGLSNRPIIHRAANSRPSVPARPGLLERGGGDLRIGGAVLGLAACQEAAGAADGQGRIGAAEGARLNSGPPGALCALGDDLPHVHARQYTSMLV